MESVISVVDVGKVGADALAAELTRQADAARVRFGGGVSIEWFVPVCVRGDDGEVNLLVVVFGPGR